MNIKDNILYSEPMSTVPNISLGQYLFDNLHNNPNDIVQVSSFKITGWIITSIKGQVIHYGNIYIY